MPQLPQESFLAPQMMGETVPKSEPPQQSDFKPQSQQPSQLIELKPQEPEITNMAKPQQSPQQSGGNKRPRMAISAEAALVSANGVAANGFSRPYGPVGTLSGFGPANPNAFRYPR